MSAIMMETQRILLKYIYTYKPNIYPQPEWFDLVQLIIENIITDINPSKISIKYSGSVFHRRHTGVIIGGYG